ncbi:MAG TPA: peptidoglycan-associated lipoprotein [Porticoccaceae bacterium]|nr:peptidoglycan-associated lipoprotein [Porticoccaceae bacterium]HCO59018.1 peptidoglycan-associated lipoprotein [Porticoccaceae bacterium]
MKQSVLKTTFVISLLSLFLAACSTSSTSDTAGAGTSTISGSDVTTGSVSGDGVSGSGIDTAGDVETVFYFDFDKSVLKPEALAALRIHAQRLLANPVNVRVEGHADERGTREYNMALGERRGAAVKEFLMLQGVDGSLVEVISYGEERPLAMGSNEADWAVNRRAELK